jgi:hypothetical protein
MVLEFPHNDGNEECWGVGWEGGGGVGTLAQAPVLFHTWVSAKGLIVSL